MFFNKTFGIKSTKSKEEFIKFFNGFSDKEIVLRRFEKIFGYKTVYDDNEYDNFNDSKPKYKSCDLDRVFHPTTIKID